MSNTMALKVLRGLLMKAIKLIDAEINKEEGVLGTCPHTDAAELFTMGMNNKIYMCNMCGEQFSEEVQNELPQTMGKRKIPGDGDPGRAQTTEIQGG